MPIAHKIEGRPVRVVRNAPLRSTRATRHAGRLGTNPPSTSNSLIATPRIRIPSNPNKTNNKVFSNRNKNTYFQAHKRTSPATRIPGLHFAPRRHHPRNFSTGAKYAILALDST